MGAALRGHHALGARGDRLRLPGRRQRPLPHAPLAHPQFDNPKLDRSPALLLFGAGREKRIYAVPPHAPVRSLDSEDHPFTVETWAQPCALCGAASVFLDEIVVDDKGGRMFVCSDTDFCGRRREASPGGLAR